MVQSGKTFRILTWMADISLLLCLCIEIIFAHTFVSQASLVLFFCCTALLALQQKRLHLSWWMVFAVLLIIWSAIVSFGWALDQSVSLNMVKTLIITTAFLFFVYQYILLRADLKRFLAIYVFATVLVVIYLFIKEGIIDTTISRFGAADGVHPNLIGMVSAFAFGACIVLAGKKRRIWWLLPMPILLFAVVLTMSVKSAALAGVLLVVLLLVRFPRHWGWKLFALGICGGVIFYIVVLTENPLSTGVLARVREVAMYVLRGEGDGGSTTERFSLIQAAWNVFLQRPMTGWGLGSFRFQEGSLGMYSHNNYLELLVSGGIPMALIYYIGQIYAIIYAVRKIRWSKAEDTANERADERKLVMVFCVFLVLRFILDLAVVSYYERQDTIFAILLLAAARLLSLPRELQSNTKSIFLIQFGSKMKGSKVE